LVQGRARESEEAVKLQIGVALVAALLVADWMMAPSGYADAPVGRYTYPQDGVVYDTQARLTWQRGTDPMPETWANGMTYCQTLALAGGGWRLPSVKELQTIIDESVDTLGGKAALDARAFPGAPAALDWWSSSLVADDPHAVWIVRPGGFSSTVSDPNTLGNARCVR
jgi:Protein of unknown function (DUF1566)